MEALNLALAAALVALTAREQEVAAAEELYERAETESAFDAAARALDVAERRLVDARRMVDSIQTDIATYTSVR